MNVIRKTFVFTSAILCALAYPCMSAPAGPMGKPGGYPVSSSNRFAVGAAAIVSESPYVGADPRIIPVPLFSYRGPRFQLNGIRASYSLIQSPYYSISPVAQWRFSPYESDDSPALQGMQERPNTVDAGLRLSGPRFLPLDTGIEVRGDTFGAYDGLVTSLDLGWRFRYQKGMFRPFIRTEWLSPKLAEHLYGVRPDEVLPDRPAYSPDGTWQISLDSLLVHAFDNRWEFTASAGLVFLDSEATESPIVDKSTLWRTMAGFGYRF